MLISSAGLRDDRHGVRRPLVRPLQIAHEGDHVQLLPWLDVRSLSRDGEVLRPR